MNAAFCVKIWTHGEEAELVTRSSTEAEFLAMVQEICDLLRMEIVSDDLQVKYEAPMKLFCDNKPANSIAHNLVQHDRKKYIEID